MKNVIVVGYPKSGNTWVTRLVAELLDCPVVGFWNSPKKEMAAEGENRLSEFRCYKAHQQLHELDEGAGPADHRLIYVIRDPRDIAVSGAHYFKIERFAALTWLLGKLLRGGERTEKTLQTYLTSETYRITQMSKAILYGSAQVHHWCRVSWKTHYKPYLDRGILFVHYEDLHLLPVEECTKIMNFLCISKDVPSIRRALDNQSFHKRKREFQESGNARQAEFLRSGRPGEWKEKLTARQQKLFLRELSQELKSFSYPV